MLVNSLTKKEAKQQSGLWERASNIFSWKPYLIGKEFTQSKDHKPNLAIARGKTQVYDSLSDDIKYYLPFKLKYLSGKNMFADVLSTLIGFSAAIEPTSRSIPELLRLTHDKAEHWSTKYINTWPTMAQTWITTFVLAQPVSRFVSANRTTRKVCKKLEPKLYSFENVYT